MSSAPSSVQMHTLSYPEGGSVTTKRERKLSNYPLTLRAKQESF